MKIGKFGEKNNLSIDTIRHYMDLGLIIPEKKGGHYFFDECCQKDIELILEYKWLGFSLNEIKELFLYKSLAKSMNYEKDTFYQSLFKLKYEKMEHEIKILKERRDKLKAALNDLSITTEISNSILGIDLRVLNFLTCFKCSGNLILQDGIINSNQIMEGKLTCNCGEEYVITSGILTAGKSFETSDRASFEDPISDYIHETDSSYLENEIFLLHELNSLLKPDCYLLSSFILFKNFSINSQITTRFRDNFTSSKVKREIQKLQFNSIDERTSEYIERGGKYEDFFVQGEEIYTYSFFGKRWG
ncbi:MerR family transcriptional regulator [Bacillus cereus]|uniref:MerR family transcriptional regulator n=1 Tax=Bacillus cereus TaxID=1396 RepID=UPI00256FC4CE|nr:MerR family transcriptional regulator [Bacillus cereus]WJE25523.1 MerR family transcriptional regulator [Bacillus cereus]